MKLGILGVGSVRGPLRGPISDFQERAGRYWRLQVDEVPAGLGKGRRVDEGAVREAEEERLLARLPDQGESVALTREGVSINSRDLARFLEERAIRSVAEVTFIIGGAFGLGERILRGSTLRLSLSTLTLPHELARLVLLEQLYRAGTILRNEPYHKGP